MDKVKEFLESEQKVSCCWVILAQSTFGRELELDLWESYKSKADSAAYQLADYRQTRARFNRQATKEGCTIASSF
jgi:hypothetical protein